MSKTVMFISLLFFCASLNAQTVQDQDTQSLTAQQQFCKHKIARYTKTRNAGSVLVFTGVLTAGAGTWALVSYTSDQNKPHSYYDDEDDSDTKYTLGLIGLELGIDMVIGGVILNTVGWRKIRQYRQKLNKLTLGASLQPNSKGFTLCYHF